MSPPDNNVVLVVDDDPQIQQAFARILGHAGFRVEAFADGLRVPERVARGDVDAIVSDITMPMIDGISLLRGVRRVDLDVPVILVTGAPSLQTAIEAVEHGAFRYLPKPVMADSLTDAVRHAVQLRRVAKVRRELAELGGAEAQRIGDRAGLEAHFDHALRNIFVHYQPIVRWSARRVYAYEVLVRSTEPMLPHPGALFDAAERLERLHDLGRAIRRLAALPVKELPGDVLLFVNLHTQDLLDEDLYDPAAPLSSARERVVLEITERARLEQVDDVRLRLERLRAMGFRVAIDDIGAGYAGLSSFTLLTPEVVKLDMSLIRGIDAHPTKQKLVRSLVTLFGELGLPVIAEGIETGAERDAVLQLGCDLLQGYLIARPGPAFPAPAY